MRILVADGDAKRRESLRTAVPTLGFDVTEVETTSELLAYATTGRLPALVVVGLDLVDSTHTDVLNALRGTKSGPLPYVVGLASRGELDRVPGLLRRGMDDFLTSPWHPLDLEARLGSARRIVGLETELTLSREWADLHSLHDPVTGLLNRRGTEEALDRELVRAAREAHPLTLCFVRIDRFSVMARRLANEAGDLVAHEAARRLQDVVRPYDTVTRFAKSTFCVLLPGADETTAVTIAERLRTSIGGIGFLLGDTRIVVTASVGCVSTLGTRQEDGPLLFDAANDAVRKATSSGGNRVEVGSTGSASRLSVRIPRPPRRDAL